MMLTEVKRADDDTENWGGTSPGFTLHAISRLGAGACGWTNRQNPCAGVIVFIEPRSCLALLSHNLRPRELRGLGRLGPERLGPIQAPSTNREICFGAQATAYLDRHLRLYSKKVIQRNSVFSDVRLSTRIQRLQRPTCLSTDCFRMARQRPELQENAPSAAESSERLRGPPVFGRPSTVEGPSPKFRYPSLRTANDVQPQAIPSPANASKPRTVGREQKPARDAPRHLQDNGLKMVDGEQNQAEPARPLPRSPPSVQYVATKPAPPLPSTNSSRRPIDLTSDVGFANLPSRAPVPFKKPSNPPFKMVRPVDRPIFSSFANLPYNAVNLATGKPSNVGGIPLSSKDSPSQYKSTMGHHEPDTYLDAGQTTESIKALLEGTFEEDNPRTRSGKQKKDAKKAQELVDRMDSLGLQSDREGVVKQQNNDGESGEEKAEAEAEDDDSDPEPYEDGLVEGMKVKLLPHQVRGLRFLLRREEGESSGGILADDMGLGKTIQALALIITNTLSPVAAGTKPDVTQKTQVNGGTLVVAPLALIKQWEREISDRILKTHALSVCIHHGPSRTKRASDLKKYDVVITTYDIVRSEHSSSDMRLNGLRAGCFGLSWYRVILDEAHSIKNRNAKSTKACYDLVSRYRWCLTGTPMQNNLDELQSLIRFLQVKPYNDQRNWKEGIIDLMNRGKGKLAMQRLRIVLKAIMLRRTKDVLKQDGALTAGGQEDSSGTLTNKFVIVKREVLDVVVSFEPHEQTFYDKLEQRTDMSLEAMMGGSKMSYASALVLLLRLRQACNHPELSTGNIAKDGEALAASQATSSSSSQIRQHAVKAGEVDDIADMFGCLTVETKNCETCGLMLVKALISTGAKRCEACVEDLEVFETATAKSRPGSKRPHASKARAASAKGQSLHSDNSHPASRAVDPRRRPRRVVDSDDDEEGERKEEESAEWITPEDQRGIRRSVVGDEDATDTGESLGSVDADDDQKDLQDLSRDSQPNETHPTSQDSSRTTSAPRSSIATNSTEASSTQDLENALQETSDSDSSQLDTVSSHMSQIVASTKIRELVKILRKHSPAHKFIVFSQFTSMLDLIEPFLKQHRLVYTRYDGRMKNDAREASLERLRSDRCTRVLLCSLKCGSLGLNLTVASRVVILEPFWNPFVEEQAIDRVHRLNQTVDVVVYKLTVANTVEERILALQQKKRELARAAIEEGDGTNNAGGVKGNKLSLKDIMYLFRKDAELDHSLAGDGGLGGLRRDGLLSPTKGLGGVPVRPFGDTAMMRGHQNRQADQVRTDLRDAARKKRQEDPLWGRRW